MTYFLNKLIFFSIINRNQINYLFHGQCVYSFPVKILNENEVELVWGYKGRDCVYDVLFDETFNLPKGKIPQKGKPFSKYTIENNTINWITSVIQAISIVILVYAI